MPIWAFLIIFRKKRNSKANYKQTYFFGSKSCTNTYLSKENKFSGSLQTGTYRDLKVVATNCQKNKYKGRSKNS